MKLDSNTYVLFAAKNYDNPQCHDQAEFFEDLNRIKNLRRLFKRYTTKGQINERLVLNNIITLYNVFGTSATQLLFFQLKEYHYILKPFLVTLNFMPDIILGVGDEIIRSSDIAMDPVIVELLRNI